MNLPSVPTSSALSGPALRSWDRAAWVRDVVESLLTKTRLFEVAEAHAIGIASGLVVAILSHAVLSVLTLCPNGQVVRTNASLDVAPMKHTEASRNRTLSGLVGQSVSGPNPPFKIEDAVAIPADGGTPQPARRRLLHLVPKSLSKHALSHTTEGA